MTLVVGNVTYAHLPSASDGWKPEWVKLVLKNYDILKCSFDGTSRMDGNDETEPTFLDFVCKPEGNTATINELLCMKNVGAQIAMDFTSYE